MSKRSSVKQSSEIFALIGLFFTVFFTVASISPDAKILIQKLIHRLGIEKDISRESVSFSLFILSMVSFAFTLTRAYIGIRNHITSIMDDFKNILVSIKAYKSEKSERDVIRHLLKVRIGEDVVDKILGNGDFPIALVPGGDIAIIMNQENYSSVLQSLLQGGYYDEVMWTTFVPFQYLNRKLSRYEENDWDRRLKEGWIEFTPKDNKNYYKYVSIWSSIPKARQVIILEDSDPEHEVYYKNYMDGEKYRLDLIKYLSVRYGIFNDKRRGEFFRKKESDFLSEDLRQLVLDRDNMDKHVRWTTTSMIRTLGSDRMAQMVSVTELHNLDFVYFKRHVDFALVRIDPQNFVSESNGGIIGITILVHTPDMLGKYSSFFDGIFDEKNSFKTFQELVEKFNTNNASS